MITIDGLKKSYGDRLLFADVSFNVNARERIGLVGRNGHGKSTLLKMIIGDETVDEGVINTPRHYRIGFVRQHLAFTEDTVIAEAAKGLPAEERETPWRAAKILSGLGFSDEDMQRSPSSFSGGYQVRLNLAAVLVSEPNMLLLDEPTNYLDITSIRWLEGFLRAWKGEMIVVTHDRSFMDAVTTHTVGIHRKKVRKVEGGTDKLYEQIAREEEIHEKTRLNEEAKRKDTELFISRFRAKARLAGMVQSRIKTLEKMGRKDKLEAVESLEFSFREKPIPSGKVAVSAKNLSFGYDKSNPLFENVSFSATTGERVCIVGNNGRGKSTLLKVLSGILEPDEGEVLMHHDVAAGTYEQTNIDRLDDAKTVEEEIGDAAGDGDRQFARTIAGCMMFPGDDALKRVSVLSGGEKSRVMLGRILAQKVNVLFLDEPTNHLDMDSADALLAAIDNFAGAVVMVTHNESFLHALADRLIVFGKQGVDVFEGTYGEFLEKRGWDDDDSTVVEKKSVEPKITKKDLRRERSRIITEKNKTLKPLQADVERIESAIHEAEERLAELNASMVAASESGDGQTISSVAPKIAQTEALIEELFESLESASEALDAAEKRFDAELAELDD